MITFPSILKAKIMLETIVSVDSLTFHYPTKTALENISFTMPPGNITALVGPNGAGKTTLMRCLAGLDTPFSGRIHIAGTDVLENPRQAHAKIGYLSDSFGLYDELTVFQILEYIGGCHTLSGTNLAERIDWVIRTLRLDHIKDQKCATLSRGWRQRVGIGMSIIHKPEILILDEPASGLDPEARAELSSVLKSLQSDGMTIMVSSHILAELEEYCTAMLVIRDGKIQDNIVLSSHQSAANVMLEITLAEPLTAQQETSLRGKYANLTLLNPERLQLQSSAAQNDHHLILKDFIEAGVKVSAFVPAEKNLQTLYLEMAQAKG
jgi:ABC-2 type transport system ATP-binding protein